MANEFKIKKGLIVQGSGSTILDIQGSQGQLLSVTDNSSGLIRITGNTLITGSLTALNQTASFGYVSASFLDITGKQVVRGYSQYLPTSDIVPISTPGGYIYSSGSQGDLYFAQTNGSIKNVVRLRWIEGNMYSGLLNGGVITTQSSTVYQVSSGSGIIVSLNGSLSSDPYPAVNYISWSNLSSSIAPLSASFDQSFVAIEASGSTGIIYAQGTPYDDGQFNTLIPIGNVIHQNRTSINATATYPSVAYGYKQRSSDFIRAFGALKLSGLDTIVSGSSTGSLQVTSGKSYSDGRNYVTDVNNPSYVQDTGQPISKIFRYYQSGSGWVYLTNGGAGFETIDPTQYSLNGTLTPVPGTGINREFTIQRVLYFPGGATKGIYVYYGNQTYPTATAAIANIPYESFIEAPNTSAGAILSAYLIVRNNADFTVPDSYNIRPAGLFRNIGGTGGAGGAIAQTLSGLSDVDVLTILPTNGQPLVYDSATLKWKNASSLTANLIGTASYATQAVSASYALTASYALNGGGTTVNTSSLVTTASFNSFTSSYNTGSFTGSFSGSFSGNAFIQSGNSFGTTALLGTNDNQSLALETSGSERMRITNAGKVGIGTSSPNESLEVIGRLRVSNGGSPLYYAELAGQFSPTSGYLAFRGGVGSGMVISSENYGSDTAIWSNNSEKIRILSGGNVGIGITAPTTPLHVSGTIQVQTATGNTFYGQDSGGSYARTFGVEVYDFRDAAGATKVRINTSTGNVGIGTTSPNQLLHLEKTQNTYTNLRIRNNDTGSSAYTMVGLNSSGNSWGIRMGSALANSNRLDFVIDAFGVPIERMSITSGGNVGIGTTAPTKLLDVNGDVLINGQTVGRGGGNISSNTTVGPASLTSNTTGTNNVSIGTSTLFLNTTGANNVAIGSSGLGSNISGGSNTAIGQGSLQNSTGGSNTAIGQASLSSITSGGNNIAFGRLAGRFIADKVTLLTSIDNSVLIGYQASPLGQAQTNQIVIGYDATGIGSNSVVLGNDSIVTTVLKGNVGIGTTAPTAKLQVTAGDILIDNNRGFFSKNTGGSSLSLLKFDTSNNAQIGSVFQGGGTILYATNEFIFYNYPSSTLTERMRITSTGNVGIGTTTPTQKLDVVGSTKTDVLYLGGTSNYLDIATGMRLRSDANGINFVPNGTQAVKITAAGNVGIGTTTPDTKLHIEDVTKVLTNNVAGVAQGTLSLVSTDALAADIGPSLIFGGNYITGNSTRIAYAGIAGRKANGGSTNADGYLSFLTWRTTGLAEAMRITPAGFLALGTTVAGVRFVNAGGVAASGPTLGSGYVGSQALVSENGLYGMWSGVSNNGDVWHQVQRNDGNTAAYNLLFNPAGGNVGIGTTAPTAKLEVNGNVYATSFTGSLFGTASWAQNVITATNAQSASNFVITSTLQLDGTLTDYASVNSTIVGANNLYTQATGSYTSAFVKYTLSNGVNVRAGQFMTAWSGSTTIYTDTSTGDLGNTSDIVFSSAIVSSQIQINATAASSGWKLKTLATFI